jgi:hypothetical protein
VSVGQDGELTAIVTGRPNAKIRSCRARDELQQALKQMPEDAGDLWKIYIQSTQA